MAARRSWGFGMALALPCVAFIDAGCSILDRRQRATRGDEQPVGGHAIDGSPVINLLDAIDIQHILLDIPKAEEAEVRDLWGTGTFGRGSARRYAVERAGDRAADGGVPRLDGKRRSGEQRPQERWVGRVVGQQGAQQARLRHTQCRPTSSGRVGRGPTERVARGGNGHRHSYPFRKAAGAGDRAACYYKYTDPAPKLQGQPAMILARFPTPYWSAPNALLYFGEVRACLRTLPARSVHLVVTSPPYWGLRMYATGDGKHLEIGCEPSPDCKTWGQAQCGACFVCVMVDVFREVWRVLRDDGVAWLNLGDTYTSTTSNRNGLSATTLHGSRTYGRDAGNVQRSRPAGLPQGNLVGVPWRVALALQSDGWVLQSDVPWVKRAAMPESADKRPCKSLEYVFLLAKGSDHYFDMDAVRPAALNTGGGAVFGRASDPGGADEAGAPAPRRYDRPEYSSRGFRNSDLWFQSVEEPYGLVGVGDEMIGLDVTNSGQKRTHKKTHFAMFPPRLVEPLVLSGTSEYGCCADCGRPWDREVVRNGAVQKQGDSGAAQRDRSYRWSRNGVDSTLDTGIAERETAGWRKACGCRIDEVVPCVVMDPFVGSGTTVATALRLGRAGVGIDLSEAYLLANAIPRVGASLATGARGTHARPLPSDTPPPPRRMRG